MSAPTLSPASPLGLAPPELLPCTLSQFVEAESSRVLGTGPRAPALPSGIVGHRAEGLHPSAAAICVHTSAEVHVPCSVKAVTPERAAIAGTGTAGCKTLGRHASAGKSIASTFVEMQTLSQDHSVQGGVMFDVSAFPRRQWLHMLY